MNKHIPETHHIFPLSKGSKIPESGSGGFKDALPVAEALKKWPNIRQGNVGLYPGPSGILIIDVDIKTHKDGTPGVGVETMNTLQADHGKLPETFTVKTPSGGWHLYFKKPDIERVGNDSIGKDIDIRCDGGYVLEPGSKVDGGMYSVIKEIPLTALPDTWVELFRPKKTPCKAAQSTQKARNQYSGTTTKQEVEESLEYVDTDLPHDDWVSVLMALHSEGYDDLAHSYSLRSTQYSAAEVDKVLASCTGSGITIATVFHYAKKGGYNPNSNAITSKKTPAKPSQAASLVTLAQNQDMELFHDPSGVTYASVEINGVTKTMPVRGKDFRNLLRRELYKQDGRNASAQAIDDALGTLEGQALFDGVERDVGMRIAGSSDDIIWLDLGGEDWQSVKITADGWSIVKPSVKWRRPSGLRALPVPTKGGMWQTLFDIFPLPEEQRVLVVAWLVMSLNPKGPYPLLILQGEQGTGKSTLSRILRGLIDPNAAPIRTAPRNEHDLIVAAQNGWVIAVDNLSGMPPWLSDGLCRLATGGGFASRALYSNGEEHIIEATRPIIINGIDDMAARPDLADRAIILNLEPIDKANVKTEQALQKEYEQKRPAIMGALLGAVSVAMMNLPTTNLDEYPRMADFAQFIAAAEPALWASGTFMRVYTQARAESVAAGLDGSPVATAIRDLMQSRDHWKGTATYLLDMLPVDDKTAHLKIWPKTARGLSNILRRLAPSLRADGLDVTFIHSHGRRIEISHIEGKQENTCISASPASLHPKPIQDNGLSGDATGTQNKSGTQGGNVSYPLKPLQDNASGTRDARDAEIYTQSCKPIAADNRKPEPFTVAPPPKHIEVI